MRSEIDKKRKTMPIRMKPTNNISRGYLMSNDFGVTLMNALLMVLGKLKRIRPASIGMIEGNAYESMPYSGRIVYAIVCTGNLATVSTIRTNPATLTIKDESSFILFPFYNISIR